MNAPPIPNCSPCSTLQNLWGYLEWLAGVSAQRGSAFSSFLMGPLYLLIYFPDCCLTFLELLPPQPLQWLMQGRSWILVILVL